MEGEEGDSSEQRIITIREENWKDKKVVSIMQLLEGVNLFDGLGILECAKLDLIENIYRNGDEEQ